MKRAIVPLVAALAAVFASMPRESAAEGPVELNIGSIAPKGTPWMDMLERIESKIETASNGRINVILRPPGPMSEVDMVKEVHEGGKLQGAGVTTAAVSQGASYPLLQLIELPYLFESHAEVDYVLDNVLWQPVTDGLSKRGFVLAAWSENGFRGFATKDKAVRSVADLKGQKMRSQESDVHVAMYNAYGASPVQQPMSDVLPSLQSGSIDGFDATPLYCQTGGLGESISHFTLSNHIYQPAVILWSKKWHDALPADLRAIVDDIEAEGVASRAVIRAEDRAMIDNFQLFGVDVVELTPEARAEFTTKGRAMHAGFAATLDGGPEFLKLIDDGIAKARAK